jgi:hypothetical protein
MSMDETKIETAHGTLTVTALHAARLSLCYGCHTGWYKEQDRLLYVVGRLALRSDGNWGWTSRDGEPGVYPVKNGKADWDRAYSAKQAAPILEAMRAAALDWVAEHPEFLARVEADEAATRVAAARQRISDIRSELARAERALADAEAARADADARLDGLGWPVDREAPLAGDSSSAAPTPWSVKFDETGGYDCTSAAYRVLDAAGDLVCAIDVRDFVSEGDDRYAENEAAAEVANRIASAVNLTCEAAPGGPVPR